MSVMYDSLQIWDAVDSKQGYLTRTGIYTALALAALAQQGKSVNVKLLESYSDQGMLNISQSPVDDMFTVEFFPLNTGTE